jgi:hypothetical protein
MILEELPVLGTGNLAVVLAFDVHCIPKTKNEQHRNMRRALRERERMGGVGRERERAMERARAR